MQIYDATPYATVTYMHMSNITPASSVSLGNIIGRQSNVTGGSPIVNHLHVQVQIGDNTYIASGTDTTLESTLAYYVMCWNI